MRRDGARSSAIAGQFNKTWFVGARFLTAINFNYDDADATFTQVPTGLTVGGTLQPPFVAGTPIDAIVAPQFSAGGALVAQKVSTEIKNPAQFQAGIGYSGFKNWLVEADYQWVGWSSFESLPINFQGPANIENRTLIEDYTNTSGIRLGAEYTIPTDGWKLRAGFAAAQAAAPDVTVTPLLPDQDRQYGTFGVGIPFMKKCCRVDASYAHVFTPGRRGRIAERSNVANPTRLRRSSTAECSICRRTSSRSRSKPTSNARETYGCLARTQQYAALSSWPPPAW